MAPIYRILRRFLRVLLRRHRSREVDSGSQGSSHTSQSVTRSGILSLPLELLQLVFEHLQEAWKLSRLPSISHLDAPLPKTISDRLIPLSMVNRQMRVLIRPLLFRIVCMDPTQLPPAGVWPYIHYLHVYPPRFWGRWDISQSFLRQMPHLSSVYWHGEGTERQEPLQHLLVFMTSPTLRNLTMSSIWLCAAEDGIDTFIAASAGISLGTLRIDFPEHVLGRRVPPGFAASHLECLNRFLAHLRPRLESLTLSGYSTQLSALAVAPWPSLRVFSVTRGPAMLDIPWMQLLGMMPQLRSLTIALERGTDPLIVCPCEPEATAYQTGALSHLFHLTLSHPSPDDRVFLHLPLDLRQLALRDTPRYYDARNMYRWRNSGQKEPILKCSEVLSIVGKMSLTTLEALELVYLEDGNEFDMLGLLSQSCPRLRLLELHRYPQDTNVHDAWYKGKLTTPVESVADALAAFQSVRVLKLNFCFVDDNMAEEYAGLVKPPDYWDKLSLFLETQARIIARRVPFVDTLALLCWSRGSMKWRTWSVYHDFASAGADTDEYPHLAYEDVYDKAFPGGVEWGLL